MPEIPLKSDRSARDCVNYPFFHAKDLEDGAPVQHNPIFSIVGQAGVWDGVKLVPILISTAVGSQRITYVSVDHADDPGVVAVYTPLVSHIFKIICVVRVAFDGTGVEVQIGNEANPDLYFSTDPLYGDLDLSTPGVYEKDVYIVKDSVDEDIQITFDPGINGPHGILSVYLFYATF